MGRKETEDAIADSRAGRVAGRFGSVAELLADLNADDTPETQEGSTNASLDELLAQCDPSAELTAREREWLDAPAVGREVLTPFDPAEHLTNAEAVAALLADAEATGDPAYIEHAHQVAARARAMHGIK